MGIIFSILGIIILLAVLEDIFFPKKKSDLEYVNDVNQHYVKPNKQSINITPKEKQKYLSSKKWKKLRDKLLDEYSYKCAHCGDTHNLNIHHITYERWKHERIDDLVVLCEKCHTRLHERSGYDYNKTHPTTFISRS